MPLVEAQQAFLNLTEAVADAGYGLQTFKDVPTDKVVEVLKNAGYSEVVTDSGRVMWTKPWWNTSGATSTATAGRTMGQNLVSTITTEAGTAEGLVNITASSVGFTTEVSSVTEGVSMIATTPKLAVVTAVASACGLAFGYDLGQWLVNSYFGDDFDWSTDSIGGKIITYISGEKTYIDEDLANRIKDRLIDIGAFEDYKVNPINPNIDNNLSKKLYEFNRISLGDLINQLPAEFVVDALALVDHYSSELDINDSNSAYFVGAGYYDKKYRFKQVRLYKTDLNYPLSSSIIYGCINGICNTINSTIIKDINNYEELHIRAPSGYITYYISNGKIGYTNGYTLTRVQNPATNDGYAPDVFFLGNNIADLVKGEIPGVNKQQGATYPTKNTPVTTTYPNWGTNKGKVPTKDGEKTVIPLKLPKPNEGTEPQNEAQTGKYPETDPNPYIADLITDVQIPNNPDNIPTNDAGDTPTPIIPSIGVQATGFVALYNPTQSQLSSFSQYLWSNDFIDNFKKLFANPMDAIIGLHMIYATPSRGTDAEIVCGYAHSGVMSNTVNSQYIEINCGGIKVNRYFGNVLDYAPYTKLQLYLPFVGIVDLDTNEIMDGTLDIKYRIDVLTGSCLARLKITRGDYNAELYNFAGNCAVQLPISGGSYSGIIANAIGVAGSIGATIASGGALAPVLVGSAVSSAVSSHVNVSHSGSLGSNAGALGIMKPYLIITRPKPAEADNFNEFYGKPSNKTVRLSSCSGYTRVKDVHVDNIVATDNELSEIEQLLKEGVIV